MGLKPLYVACNGNGGHSGEVTVPAFRTLLPAFRTLLPNFLGYTVVDRYRKFAIYSKNATET